MKKYILIAALSFVVVTAKSQPKPAITDSGTFYLHKFAQHIGKETYYVSKTSGVAVKYQNRQDL